MHFLKVLKTLGLASCFVSCVFVLSFMNFNSSKWKEKGLKYSKNFLPSVRNLSKSPDGSLGNKWIDVDTCRENFIQQHTTRRTLWTKGYKNPCFRQRHKNETEISGTPLLQCVPYFFVAGFPKCGTTDLFDRMTGHPEFFRSSFKEIHWLTRYRFVPPRQLKQFQSFHRKYKTRGLHYGFRQYTRIFDNLAMELEYLPHSTNSTERYILRNGITGDFSPSTAWDNDFFSFLAENQKMAIPQYISADFVKDMNPCAKIIFLMRDPVDRLYSDYLFFPTHNQGPLDFHTKVLRSIGTLQDCFEARTVEECVFDVLLNKAMPVRLRLGMYHIYIKEWMKRFQHDQMLFIRLEDYAHSMSDTIQRVFDFLQMSKLPDDKIKAMTFKSPANTRPTDSAPMLESTREILIEFYKPFNAKLAELLNNPIFLWNRP